MWLEIFPFPEIWATNFVATEQENWLILEAYDKELSKHAFAQFIVVQRGLASHPFTPDMIQSGKYPHIYPDTRTPSAISVANRNASQPQTSHLITRSRSHEAGTHSLLPHSFCSINFRILPPKYPLTILTPSSTFTPLLTVLLNQQLSS